MRSHLFHPFGGSSQDHEQGRIICSDNDILDPMCSKNALLSVSIRSHVVVSPNFSFSSTRAMPFYGVVAAPPSRVERGTGHWSTRSRPFHSRH